jgi:hypothetical protein
LAADDTVCEIVGVSVPSAILSFTAETVTVTGVFQLDAVNLIEVVDKEISALLVAKSIVTVLVGSDVSTIVYESVVPDSDTAVLPPDSVRVIPAVSLSVTVTVTALTLTPE